MRYGVVTRFGRGGNSDPPTFWRRCCSPKLSFAPLPESGSPCPRSRPPPKADRALGLSEKRSSKRC